MIKILSNRRFSL